MKLHIFKGNMRDGNLSLNKKPDGNDKQPIKIYFYEGFCKAFCKGIR